MDRSKNIHKSKRVNNRIIYIVGPTSSGKTALAVHIASIFDCEIISADSRQVYKYMNIGTGKDLKEYGKIKYHCIDLVNPKTEFNLVKYIKKAKKAISDIESRNKTPLIVGGTGLYIDALIKGYDIENEKINEKLRKELSSLSKEELQNKLLKINPKIKDTLNNSDWNNPHRLIRHIERSKSHENIKYVSNICNTHNNLIIGISVQKEILHKRIHKRIIDRIGKEGMIEEIYNLHHKNKVSWKRLESFGLEYKFLSQYLRNNNVGSRYIWAKNKNNNLLQQTINNLSTATNQYAKRQITWFNKTPELIWLDGSDKNKLYKKTEKLVKDFINKKDKK